MHLYNISLNTYSSEFCLGPEIRLHRNMCILHKHCTKLIRWTSSLYNQKIRSLETREIGEIKVSVKVYAATMKCVYCSVIFMKHSYLHAIDNKNLYSTLEAGCICRLLMFVVHLVGVRVKKEEKWNAVSHNHKLMRQYIGLFGWSDSNSDGIYIDLAIPLVTKNSVGIRSVHVHQFRHISYQLHCNDILEANQHSCAHKRPRCGNDIEKLQI